MTMRHLRAAAAAALACTAIASCSSGHADVTPTVVPTPTTTASPSLAPGPAAIAVYREFTRRTLVAWNKRSSAGLNLDSYAASGSTLAAVESEITDLKANDHTLTGQPILTPKVASATNLVVHLSDCVDNSQIKIVDGSGKRTNTGPTRIPTKVTVERLSESDPWLVTKESPDFTGTKC